MKPPQDLPEDLARLLEKREKSDRRASKTPGAAASKPPVERRKKTRRKP